MNPLRVHSGPLGYGEVKSRRVGNLASAIRVTKIAAAFSAAVSFSVLFGIVTGRPALTQWVQNAPAMELETVAGIFGAAAGLWFATQKRRLLTAWTARILLTLGLINLLVRGFGVSARDFPWLANPGLQVASGTSIAFVLIAIALLIASQRSRPRRAVWLIALFGAIVISIGLITIVGHVSGLDATPWWGTSFLKMSVPTAAVCCAFGIALLALFFQHAEGDSHQFSITAAVLAIIGLLLLFAGADTAILASSNSILTTRTEIRNISDQMRSVQVLMENARAAEAGQRGYLLAGERQYLKAFYVGQEGFLGRDQSRDGENAELVKTIQLKFEELNRTIALEGQGNHEGALRLVKSSLGLHLMEEIESQERVRIDRLQKELALRLDESRRFVLSVRNTILWSYAFAALLAACSLLLVRSEVKRRSRIEGALRENETRLAAINEELRKQTFRAEEANSAKSIFLASMSHEIRTPMNAILGMADMLWESDLSQTQRNYVEVFRRAGGNLLTLINDILDLSKIESGNFRLEEGEIDLPDMVDHLFEILSPKVEAKTLSLVADLGSGAATRVLGDATRLQQVLLNLLGNAVKFTNQGEVVLRVRSRVSATHVDLEFEVSDTGIGIPEDKLSSVFDDFTQAESSTTRRFGGTGLGLGISQRLVRYMGGELGVRSELGKGSTFFFGIVLPIDFGRKSSVPAQSGEIAGQNVLIVDNDPTNRVILSEMCSAWGLVVTCCSSGEEAVESTRTSVTGSPFALALVDRMMPGMDGFETACQIRTLDPAVAILMISSDGQIGDLSRCRQLGFAGHLMKPVRRTELLREIAGALGNRAPVELPKPLENTLERFKVLVAEDSADNRLLLQAYCAKTAYDLIFTEDGKQAVAAYQSGSFDLVVMDVQMPVMDGLAATSEIRKLEKDRGQRRVPILALTANALPQDVTQAIQAGCDAHVTKPISKSNFLTILDRWRPMSSEPAPRIEIPEGLEELAHKYLGARKRELSEIEALLKKLDFEGLGRLGHDLKGSGSSFGFPGVTRFGAAMEQAAKSKDLTNLQRAFVGMSTYIETAVLQTAV